MPGDKTIILISGGWPLDDLRSATQEEIAYLHRRAYEEAQRRQREAEELARLARMLTESLDAADVGERIVESERGLLDLGRYGNL